ncbi:MAG TPA: hypothetical protein VGI48_00935 [Caldimonas sp.]|jgi:hypothetical protein
MTPARLGLLAAVACVVVVGCGERVQTIPPSGERKADTPVWQLQDKRFVAPGWTVGDEHSWNAEITDRAQGQNDYAPRK